MSELHEFTKGARVRYHGSKAEFVGRDATVIRPVKSRKVVTVEFDGANAYFDAFPSNLTILREDPHA